MKFLFVFLLTLLSCAEYIRGLKFVNPVVYEIQDRFGLTWDQFKGKCDSKGANLFPPVSNLRDKYDSVSAQVKADILNRARQTSSGMTEAKWDQLINTKCIVNSELISTSQQAIDRIVLCLDNNGGLSGQQKEQAKKDLLKKFCSQIRMWAKFEYDNYNSG
ncbi:uncharacterized protein LOC122500853 [Leptopilina heterotoma]|uniref:uncharacterized protein LOC122500853 n=1 Tax=Leptopilina heterotoma TaxID=63436 RepID=UPI001CA9B6BC|nr:uncharacterized protein LOC122500853 [Leptopilina heterotoma]